MKLDTSSAAATIALFGTCPYRAATPPRRCPITPGHNEFRVAELFCKRGEAVARHVKPAKAMTIRLSADQAAALETVASVDDCAASDITPAAITEHIAVGKRDPVDFVGWKSVGARQARRNGPSSVTGATPRLN